MRKIFKKAKFLLSLYDGVWSIPLALVMFIGSGLLIQRFFTDPSTPESAPGFYDPSFIQAAFYTSFICVFINFTVWMGMYFNFRGVWRYFVGKKKGTVVQNLSKDDFTNITAWQRILVLLALYSFLSVEWLFLFSLLR
jgi:hypothetical protein